MKRAAAFAAALIASGAGLLAPARLPAQSLLATNGLGVPTPPLDARAQALGNVSTGLFGLDLSLGNPADAASVRYRGGMATLQPFSRTDEIGGARSTTSGARFPVLRILYPAGRAVLTLGYGGFLDQSWAVSSSSVAQFGPDTATVEDVVQSAGGISQLRLGAAYNLTPHVALGAAVGLYTGNVTRQITRTFPDSASDAFFGVTTRTQWGFHGPLASLGARADIATVLRLAGALTWAGTLRADSVSGAAAPRSYKLPLQGEVGISALLSPQLSLSVGGHWAGWSKTAFTTCTPSSTPGAPACPPATLARNTWEVGGGLEYGGAQAGARTFPLRVGYRYARLPFYRAGDVLPTEKAFSVGAGMRVGGSANSPAAQLDGALERGSRKGGPANDPLSESFWRMTFSLAIFGV